MTIIVFIIGKIIGNFPTIVFGLVQGRGYAWVVMFVFKCEHVILLNINETLCTNHKKECTSVCFLNRLSISTTTNVMLFQSQHHGV